MSTDVSSTDTIATRTVQSPWLTVAQAAKHASCGKRSIYLAVQQRKLRAARLGGRRELRFLAEWVDSWLIETSKSVVVN